MKLYKNLIFFCFGVAMMGCTTSEDEEKQHYDNKLFISASTLTEEIKFTPDEVNPVMTSRLSVGISKPEEHDILATILPKPDLLDSYRKAYYDEGALILPEECYVMKQTETTISAGGITSPELPIEFLNLGHLKRELTYVLPVTIKAVDGIDILQSAKTYYYVFHAASLVNVVCNLHENRAYPDFNGDSKFNNLKENTLEILFKADGFPNTINTLMGIEGQYLLRLGDAGVPSNQLQVVGNRKFTLEDFEFKSGEWYHLAVVFSTGNVTVYVNGEEKGTGNVNKSYVNLGSKHTNEGAGESRCFWIGYSYSADRFFDGVVSEVRIWNRALTADEINAPNHMYKVDPESEGLLSYWRFNEGFGKVVKDQTANGYDLTIENEPTWIPVSLPD